MYLGYFESPIGLIEVGSSGDGIVSLAFVEGRPADAVADRFTREAVRQLAEYFDRRRRSFELPLQPAGTDFQLQVWNALLTIPYGQTRSYRDVAETIGRPDAVRAVGSANGQNPISILVPCHRVLGSDGKLVGYGGGLWRKEWLLQHEGGMLL
jgi:methylated-DNA-[protein]-cysteine S-methyltransferase